MTDFSLVPTSDLAKELSLRCDALAIAMYRGRSATGTAQDIYITDGENIKVRGLILGLMKHVTSDDKEVDPDS